MPQRFEENRNGMRSRTGSRSRPTAVSGCRARADRRLGERACAFPTRTQNSNPGKALHGGCAASIGAIAGQAIARAALGAEAAPFHTAQMQVSYLAAAIDEEVVADARLLRKGRELCFVAVDVKTPGRQAHRQSSRPRCAGASAATTPTTTSRPATTASRTRVSWGRTSARCPSSAIAASWSST